MSTTIMVVIAVAVLIVVAAVGVFGYERARTQRLRRRFGPEYERTVETAGDRKTAEKELLEREQRHQELDLKDLDPEARERYRREWTGLQEHFVDTPETAVADADRLVTLVMRDRGYPTEGFEERVALLSVDHGRTLDHYHAAHAISERATLKEAGTEDLRQAMVHYRALFEDLLAVPDDERSALPEAAEHLHGRRDTDEPVGATGTGTTTGTTTDTATGTAPGPADDPGSVRTPGDPVEAAAGGAPEHPAREGVHAPAPDPDDLQKSRPRPDERS
ncbi:hypothetical protein [Actinocorallia longicatena]|uniref:Secreted protein n=1 Tax=Actinocorallia longicatena TaxID=111803 RepID=A0ABP6Q7C3_9ACTN